MRNSLRQASMHALRPAIALSAAWMLAIAPMPCYSAGAIPVGQIAAKGHAQINGMSAVSGATIFANDRVDTEAGAIASLSLANDRRVVLLEKSSVRITSDAAARLTAELRDGGIAVLSPAKSPLIVAAGGTEIVPGKEGSLFAVELHGNDLIVSVRQGSASLVGTDRTVEVGEGKTLEASVQYHRLEGAGAPGVRNRFRIVLIVAGAALLATTLVLLIRDLETGCKVVSPSGGNCQVTH
ncbi:MAG TPA: FecR domain-containing protein [Candidatus Sulfotelmatobacter sp.]|nr:FecR domain-containing protein [Candidatus Sulfotelmatobacter sp.]